MTTGCQILIGDGLRGTDEVEVPVPNGEYCKTAKIGRAIMDADIFISLTHFKGHESTGFGGTSMLFDIAVSEGRTPFPIMLEALVIHFIYEIMREAGLRMPKTVGHAVSIVGALVIGDAAVTAGLIAAPMLIVLALTAISSFVVPSLYEPAAVLRFLFIIVGGLTGLYGIMLILGLLILNACSINPYGVPYSAPITPFEKGAMRDLVLRVGWKRLGRYKMKVQDLNGSDKREPEDF